MPTYAVIGVPTSAGAHHAGQDLAPAALRAAGLLDALAGAGVELVDTGDLAGSVWAPDAVEATVRNLEAVVGVADDVAAAVERERRAGRVPLVIGGDCTITLGVVAGLQRGGARPAVAYVDGDADLGTPERGSGILDATGVAHLLGRSDDALARMGPAYPMLTDDTLALLGYDPDDPDSTDDEFLAAHPGLRHVPYAELARDPAGHAARARTALEGAADTLVVHFDVDAVDGGDLALANFPHYGTGVTVDAVRVVLRELVASPRLGAVVLTEVNPTHDPSGALLGRYVALVVDVLGRGQPSPGRTSPLS